MATIKKDTMRTLCLVGLLGAILLLGCGGTTQVAGTVSLDGKPLEEGSIAFEPADGAGPSFGSPIKAGMFQITGDAPITPGKKRVRIRGSVKTGKQIAAGPPHPADKMIGEVRFFPAQGEPEQLQEAEVVASEQNKFDFKLESAAQ